jgi:hypothetical protein
MKSFVTTKTRYMASHSAPLRGRYALRANTNEFLKVFIKNNVICPN